MKLQNCNHGLTIISCYPLGPGLAIRVLCADEPFICNDFAETNTKLGFIVDYANATNKV